MSSTPESTKPLLQEEAPNECLGAKQIEQIFRQYESELLGTLYHLLGNLEDARDAFQEGFIKCWKNQTQISDVIHLKAWVFRVVFNAGLDLRKSSWKRKKRELPEDSWENVKMSSSPELRLIQQEEMLLVQNAVQRLVEEERSVFLLRQNGNLTYDEIAVILNIPSGTVKTRMKRALLKLQNALQAFSDKKSSGLSPEEGFSMNNENNPNRPFIGNAGTNADAEKAGPAKGNSCSPNTVKNGKNISDNDLLSSSLSGGGLSSKDLTLSQNENYSLSEISVPKTDSERNGE